MLQPLANEQKLHRKHAAHQRPGEESAIRKYRTPLAAQHQQKEHAGRKGRAQPDLQGRDDLCGRQFDGNLLKTPDGTEHQHDGDGKDIEVAALG